LTPLPYVDVTTDIFKRPDCREIHRIRQIFTWTFKLPIFFIASFNMLEKLCPFRENLNRFPSCFRCIPIFQKNRMKFLWGSWFRNYLRRICSLSQRIAGSFDLWPLCWYLRRWLNIWSISDLCWFCLQRFCLVAFTVDFIQCLLHGVFRLEF